MAAMTSIETVGIVGAGRVGGNLGVRLASTGYRVRFGMREGSDASELLGRAGPNASATTIAEAAASDVIFVAVPSGALLDAIASMGSLEGRIVVDCTNPVGPGPSLASPPEGSNAARIAKAAPGARVIKGFNTFGAEHHLDPMLTGVPADVPLASDDAEAKIAVAALAERAGFRPLDVGPLANAHLVEALALLWIHLAMKGGHGRLGAWKLLTRDAR